MGGSNRNQPIWIQTTRGAIEDVVTALKIHVTQLHYVASRESNGMRAALLRARADVLYAQAEALHRALEHNQGRQ